MRLALIASRACLMQRRRFNRTERNAIFTRAGGRCEGCGVKLGRDWHADHRRPFARDGVTEIANGRALCPDCNRQKGARMSGRVELRPFQAEFIGVVQERIANGDRTTVAWVETGSGKTLAWIALAHELAEQDVIDYVVVYAPRFNLCRQADLDSQAYANDIESPALARIGFVTNRPPLLAADLGGYVATYQAAVMAPSTHRAQAHAGRGRFLLVLDEAQFCGLGDDGGGTKAGALMHELGALAAHTVVLTGTPYRADGEEVVFCRYSEPDDDGRRHLLYDVRATYTDGVAQGYLRPFEYHLHPGHAEWQSTDGAHHERIDITEAEDHLKAILLSADVWAPIVDEALSVLRERQTLDARYRALFTCIDQDHARAVHKYVREHHSDLRVVIAVSNDGQQANDTLHGFREHDNADVLVTVRMAFIGYDHQPITVIGMLTHYRHEGHLRQIVGRGLRMWSGRPSDEQTCFVTGPDDPRLAAFARAMREEAEQGLRVRRERDGGDSDGLTPEDIGVVTEAEMDDPRAVGLRGDIDARRLTFIEQARRASGAREAPTTLDAFLTEMEHVRDQPTPAPTIVKAPARRTRREEIAGQEATNQKWARRIAGQRKRDRPDAQFHDLIPEVLRDANAEDGLGFKVSGDLSTLDDLKTREMTLRALHARES